MRKDVVQGEGRFILSRCLGLLAFCISRVLFATLRVQQTGGQGPDPSIYAFWHGRQFLPTLVIRYRSKNIAGLVSLSRDGAIMATWLACLGYRIVHGSPTRQAVTGLVRLIQVLRQGYAVGLTPDGPTGPIYCAKPGSVYLAMKTGVPIIPLGSAFSRSWVISSWDRYEIPKPFCRAILYYGPALYVPPDANLEQFTRQLDHAIREADLMARQSLCQLNAR